MALLSKDAIMQVLATVKEPELGKDIVTLNMVRDVKLCGGDVEFTVVLTTPACPLKNEIETEARKALQTLPGVERVQVKFESQVVGARPMGLAGNRIPGVKNVIAVGSGKGGVGKSTIAANLAAALQTMGAKVGLLDADLYGPSVPVLFGTGAAKPDLENESTILPLEKYHLKLMSMGFLIGETDAVVWRGPMLGKMIQQFLEQVKWGELDYLVVDLPPGTGDVLLSLSQLIPISGAVLVTTPQDVALADVLRAQKMFQQVKVPVLGYVVNMSGFTCPKCGDHYDVFKKGKLEKLGVPEVGSIPLEIGVCESGEAGQPIVLSHPQSPSSKAFLAAASQIAAHLSVLNVQGSAGQPIIIQ